nr:MAG TPA: hypothetical protein [Caudoviricetes sp.]
MQSSAKLCVYKFCLINHSKYRSIKTWMIDFIPLIIS